MCECVNINEKVGQSDERVLEARMVGQSDERVLEARMRVG
jgi:hypothetical protein